MHQRRLLVVEDDPATRRALQKYFQIRGCEVRLASTVAEGLAQLDPPPDCVILDLMLPDEGGEAVLRKIRDDGLPTRVAVCTGSSNRARLDRLATLSPDALLMKPVAIADLCLVCGLS